MSETPSVEKDAHVVVDHHVASDNPRRWIGATWVEATCSCGAVVTNRNCKFFTTAFAAHVKSATGVLPPGSGRA